VHVRVDEAGKKPSSAHLDDLFAVVPRAQCRDATRCQYDVDCLGFSREYVHDPTAPEDRVGLGVTPRHREHSWIDHGRQSGLASLLLPDASPNPAALTMTPLRTYLVGLSGPALQACLAALGDGAEVLDPRPPWRDLASREPGLVLLGQEALSAVELVAASDALSGGGWVLAVVEGDGSLAVRAISAGDPEGLDAVSMFVQDPEAHPGALLMLRRVLAEISKARHDINNPLTSALAETQILLMDAPEGEGREALLQIQEQLRRIRDLLLGTRYLRPRD
jgi:signal transduction histidine kinase